MQFTGNTVSVRVNDQSIKQLMNASTYYYVRKMVYCQSQNQSQNQSQRNFIARIVQIKPLLLSPYDVLKEHPVNRAEISNCGSISRSLAEVETFRSLEQYYDIDVILEKDTNATTSTHIDLPQYSMHQNTIIGIIFGIFFGLLFVFVGTLAVLSTRINRNNRLIAKVNQINPLNQVPVVVPWRQTVPFRLSETLPNSFHPMKTRRQAFQ
jgi:7,8-dihydro-6-hydroxymethylpterin-pyrophosphokinase